MIFPGDFLLSSFPLSRSAFLYVQQKRKAYTSFLRESEAREIPLLCGCTLTEILPDQVRYRKSDGTEGEISCDTVLLAIGMRPRLAQAESMRHCAPETSVFLVGDCVRAASVNEAVNEAFQVCLHI